MKEFYRKRFQLNRRVVASLHHWTDPDYAISWNLRKLLLPIAAFFFNLKTDVCELICYMQYFKVLCSLLDCWNSKKDFFFFFLLCKCSACKLKRLWLKANRDIYVSDGNIIKIKSENWLTWQTPTSLSWIYDALTIVDFNCQHMSHHFKHICTWGQYNWGYMNIYPL